MIKRPIKEMGKVTKSLEMMQEKDWNLPWSILESNEGSTIIIDFRNNYFENPDYIPY